MNQQEGKEEIIMKMQMTEKDKKLLIFLSIFVIVVCIGYWGIYPVIKDISNLQEDIEDQEDLKSENEFKRSELPGLQADNAEMEAQILTARKQFFPMMETDEIDDYITGIALEHGLFAYNLSISIDHDESTLAPYQFSEKALKPQENPEGDMILESDMSDLPLSGEEAMPVTTGIHVANISLRLDGEKEELLRLIDELSVSEYKLRLRKYSWGEERSVEYGENMEDFEVIIKSVLNLDIEIYMCEE